MADGIATSMLRTENIMLAYCDCPDTNIWCPQTTKLMTAIAMLEYAMNLYPKMRFHVCVVTSSLTTAIAGSTMM